MEAKTYELPRGLICPLVTPLKTGDVVDTAILDRLIEYVGSGTDALMIGDLFWGEGLVLSPEMRLDLFCAVLEIVQGRWPILFVITSRSPEITRDLLARAEEFIDRLDYPGSVFWVDYPIYYHSNRGLPQWYESLAANTSMGFALFNHAGLIEARRRTVKHKNIRTSILKKLSRVEKIQGLVFTGSLERFMNYRKAVRSRADFRMYDGEETAFLKQPSADGVVAGGANVLPQAWQGITRSSLNRYDAQQQYPDHTYQMLKTGAMLEAFQEVYGHNPAAIMKRMLHVAGILPNAHTASASEPSTVDQNQAVEEICRKYDLA